MPPEKHFERAILSLYGRPPNAAELDALAQTNSVEAALTDVLQDPPQSFSTGWRKFTTMHCSPISTGAAPNPSVSYRAPITRGNTIFWGTDVYNSATNQWSCEYGTEGEHLHRF